MTDNEIKKALECCSKSDTEDNYCDGCPYEKEMYCASESSKDCLDLINRLQAENERLQTEKDNLIKTFAECQKDVIKEFDKKLHTYVKEQYETDNPYVKRRMSNTIDKVVKEMVGEE